MHTRRLIGLLVVVLLSASPAPGQDWGLPPSLTGQALGHLLDTIASGDSVKIRSFVLTHMDEQFQSAFPMAEHVAFFQRLHADIHPFEVVTVRRTDEYAAEAVIAAIDRPLRLSIRFGLLEHPPHPFNDLSVQPVMGPRTVFTTPSELRNHLSDLGRAGRFSGVVLIARNGVAEFLEAYGEASKRYRVPNSTDTRFNIASINKMFTAVAVLQLVDKGLIDLDAPISTYLDGFPGDVGQKVTVRYLLQHRSGWGSYFDKEYYRNHWTQLRSVDDYMDFVRDIPLDFEPGSSQQYSNVGYVVLGAIVEAVADKDYYDHVREHVLNPAGMTNTDSYEMDVPVENLATGYVPVAEEDGGRYGRENTFLHSVRGTPAGGGYSTAEDLLRFDQALRNNVLLAPQHTHLFFGGFEDAAGAGPLEGSAGFAGGAPGINAVIEMDFDRGITVVVLSNYDPPAAEELARPIMEMARALD